LFDSPKCKVTKEDDGYWGTACRFENPNLKLFESAEKLKIMMTAFAKIEGRISFQNRKRDDEAPFVTRIYDTEDKSTTHIGYAKTVESVMLGGRATGVLGDKDGNFVDDNVVQQERQERWYDYYLDRCDDWIDSTRMFEALNYFAKRTTPRRLRLIHDIIMNDEWGKKALLKNNNWGVTDDKLNDFTHFLNYYDLGGEELHVEERSKKPRVKAASANRRKNKPKIDLAEAQTLLAQGLLKPWLIKKQEIYRRLALGEAQARYFSNKLGI
jgi:hypothetical protein